MYAKSLSEPESWQQLKQALPKLQVALKAFDTGTIIYRGTRSEPHDVKRVPIMQRGDRRSANTENYCTLIVDHDPAWISYPARSSSNICTNSRNRASRYGKVYVVLPEHDPVMGICAKSDYWISFPRIRMLGSGMDINYVNNMIKYLSMKYLNLFLDHDPTYEYLTQVLEHVQEETQAQQVDWQHMHEAGTHYEKAQANLFLNAPPHALLDKLRWLLNPTANRFKHVKLSGMQPTTKNQEIWFTGACHMIQADLIPTNAYGHLVDWIQSQ